MSALSKIKKAGFKLNLVGESFDVKPASKLNQQQREFLRSHKAEIISDLQAESKKNLIVTCYSPSGLCYEVEARDEEHAAWLIKMNPKPQGTHPC